MRYFLWEARQLQVVPESITNTIPSIVIEVSAMLVATIHLRLVLPLIEAGAGENDFLLTRA